MRRRQIGFSPGFLAPRLVGIAGEALFAAEPFQRGEPVAVIGVAQIVVSVRLRRLDFVRQRRRPFVPTEVPGLMQLDREREGLGLPRFAEGGTIPDPSGCRADRRERYSRHFQIGFPEVDQNRTAKGVRAPEISCLEPHRVEMLTHALAFGAPVGEDVATVVQHDLPT